MIVFKREEERRERERAEGRRDGGGAGGHGTAVLLRHRCLYLRRLFTFRNLAAATLYL